MKSQRYLESDELSAFCLELCYPIEAGISPADCIGLMIEQTPSKEEKLLLLPVFDALLAGSALEHALEKTGRFPPYMLKMLELGRISGNLDKVLPSLAGYYTREAERKAAIRRASAGPLVMLAVMAALIIVLITNVLPVFSRVFEQMGAEMPPVAAALLRAGAVVQAVVIFFAAAVAAGALWIFALSRSESGRRTAARAADAVFFRGRLGLLGSRARLASALSVLTAGGVDLDRSLERCGELFSGGEIERAAARCRQLLASGQSFPQAAQSAGLFGPMDGGILAAGFRAGSFDRAINELSRRLDGQWEQTLDSLVAKIEPALVIVLSAAVGLVLLTVMLPLLAMLSSVGF